MFSPGASSYLQDLFFFFAVRYPEAPRVNQVSSYWGDVLPFLFVPFFSLPNRLLIFFYTLSDWGVGALYEHLKLYD